MPEDWTLRVIVSLRVFTDIWGIKGFQGAEGSGQPHPLSGDADKRPAQLLRGLRQDQARNTSNPQTRS